MSKHCCLLCFIASNFTYLHERNRTLCVPIKSARKVEQNATNFRLKNNGSFAIFSSLTRPPWDPSWRTLIKKIKLFGPFWRLDRLVNLTTLYIFYGRYTENLFTVVLLYSRRKFHCPYFFFFFLCLSLSFSLSIIFLSFYQMQLFLDKC